MLIPDRFTTGEEVVTLVETNAVGEPSHPSGGGMLGWLEPGTKLVVIDDSYEHLYDSRTIVVHSERFGTVMVAASTIDYTVAS